MAKSAESRFSMEEALEKAEFGKFNYAMILLSAVIFFSVVLEAVGISFVLPVSECDLQLTHWENGILGAISILGIISSSHLWGFLADTTGRRNIIRPTLIAGFFVTLLSSFSPNFWTLVVLRYMNGFLISAASATTYAYLGEFHSNATRNRAIMTACFLCSLLSIFFPIIAWIAINQSWSFYIPFLDIVYKPWRLYILVCGVPGLICGLCLFAAPESPKFMLSVEKEEDALKILKWIYAINTKNEEEQYEIKSLQPDTSDSLRFRPSPMSIEKANPIASVLRSMWHQTVPLFQREHRRKTFLTWTMQFSIFANAQGVYMWFPYVLNIVMQYINEHPGARIKICDIVYEYHDRMAMTAANNDSEAMACVEHLELGTYQHTISLEVVYTVVFMCMGFIVGKIGQITTLFLVLASCGICGVLIIAVDIPMVAVYLFVILLLAGLGTSLLCSITVDIYPTHLRGMAVCMSLMMGRVGCVAGANFVATLIDTSCESAFLVPAIALILSGFLGFLIPRPKLDSDVENTDGE